MQFTFSSDGRGGSENKHGDTLGRRPSEEGWWRVDFSSACWYGGCALRGGQEGALHHWLAPGLVSVHAYPPFPSTVHPKVQPLRIHCSPLWMWASSYFCFTYLPRAWQGGNFICKRRKKAQSKYNCQNMYIVVEKQSSIKSKKQKHPLPHPRNIWQWPH